MSKKITIGFLILVILSASYYIYMPNKVRLDVKSTTTDYSVWNDKWVLAATESVVLFDGSTKMRAISARVLNYSIKGDIVTITRTSKWKDNITTIQTYNFDGSKSNVELVPISNKFECINCKGKIVQYEFKNILYDGVTKDITSPFAFGHNMKLEWNGSYYAKVFKQKTTSDKILIKFKPKSNYEVYNVRLFDPIYIYNDTYFCVGSICHGEYEIYCERGADNNWSSKVCFTGESKYFLQNWTMVLGNNVNWTIKIDGGDALSQMRGYCWNYTSLEWKQLISYGGASEGINQTATIPLDCIQSNKIQTKISPTGAGDFRHPAFWEGIMSYNYVDNRRLYQDSIQSYSNIWNSSEDTYTSAVNSDTNYATSDYLYADLSSDVKYIWIQFNLSFLPYGSDVYNGTVRLYVNSGTTGNRILSVSLTNPDMSAITWNNQPYTNGSQTFYVDSTGWQTIYLSDSILDLVELARKMNKTMAIRISPAGGGELNISSNNIIGYAPQIILNTSFEKNYCDDKVFYVECYDSTPSLVFEENSTGTFVKHSMLSMGNNLFNYTLNSSFYRNFSYKYTTDSWETNLESLSPSPSDTSIVLYFNGLSADRKYELGYGSNITGILSGTCTNETIYLSLSDPEYGINYTSGNNSVYMNYNRTAILTSTFSDDNSTKNLTLSLNNSVNITLDSNEEIISASVSVLGFENYPLNLKVDTIDNSNFDVVLPGTLIGNKTNQSAFTNGLGAENMSFYVPGTQIRYINLSANSEDGLSGWILPNTTLQLRGYNVDPIGVNFEDKFDNKTYPYVSNTCQGTYWIWDDFSKADTVGHWEGEYAVYLDSHIYGLASVVDPPACEYYAPYYYDFKTFNSKGIDLSKNPSTIGLEVSLTSGYDSTGWCSSEGFSRLYLYDKTSSATYLIIRPYRTTWSGNVKIKRDGEFIKFYLNDVYSDQVTYQEGHDYEIIWRGQGSYKHHTFCSKPPCSASASISIYSINISGMAGAGNMQNYSTCSFTYPILLNTSVPISKAFPSIDLYSVGSNTDLKYSIFLSANNGTTWERATNGTYHIFATSGTNLTAKIEINTTPESANSYIVNKFNLDVISGYASDVKLDVGYDGEIDWELSGQLNSSNSPQNLTLDMSGAERYAQNYCEKYTICEVPIAFIVGTAGTLEYSNISIYQEFSRVFLNITAIQNALSALKGVIPFRFYSDSESNISLTDLNIESKGNKGYNITASFYGTNLYNAAQTSLLFNWKYSPTQVNYPSGVSFYSVYPKTLNSKAVSPFGQKITSSESTSIGIWNITTTAQHLVNLYRWYSPEVNSCLKEYTCKYANQTNCSIVNSTTTENPIFSSLNNYTAYKLYDFWNLTSCNSSGLYLPGTNTFRAICSDCVKTW